MEMLASNFHLQEIMTKKKGWDDRRQKKKQREAQAAHLARKAAASLSSQPPVERPKRPKPPPIKPLLLNHGYKTRGCAGKREDTENQQVAAQRSQDESIISVNGEGSYDNFDFVAPGSPHRELQPIENSSSNNDDVDDEDDDSFSGSDDSLNEGTKASRKSSGTRKGCTVLPPQPHGVLGKNAGTTEIEAAMADFVKNTLAKGVAGIRKEFAELKVYTAPEYKFEAFTANTQRNRYKDVVCLDASRVVLTLNVPPESEYVHANSIKLEGLDRQYIATQGPLESTIPDFWRLVHQEGATSVVMLTKCIEDEKNICSQYFPEANAYENYGSMFVKNIRTETGDDKLITHTIEALPDGYSNSNVVKLLQMNEWPIRGVPEKPMCVLRLIRAIPPGLCIIHCSAGIGRTGTVILIDALISRLLKGQNCCVKEMFQSLRNQRASAVQTEAQYVLIHTCVLEYIRAKLPAQYRQSAETFADEVKKSNIV